MPSCVTHSLPIAKTLSYSPIGILRMPHYLQSHTCTATTFGAVLPSSTTSSCVFSPVGPNGADPRSQQLRDIENSGVGSIRPHLSSLDSIIRTSAATSAKPTAHAPDSQVHYSLPIQPQRPIRAVSSTITPSHSFPSQRHPTDADIQLCYVPIHSYSPTASSGCLLLPYYL